VCTHSSPTFEMQAAWRSSRRLVAPRPGSLTLKLVRYGSAIPPRRSGFTVPQKSHVDDLRSLLASPSSVLSTLDESATKADLVGYNDDWMNKYHGSSPLVVKPRDTEEVSKVVKYCYDHDIAVVPQAGNTGLVGKSDSFV
jgi:hypothetical protein